MRSHSYKQVATSLLKSSSPGVSARHSSLVPLRYVKRFLFLLMFFWFIIWVADRFIFDNFYTPTKFSPVAGTSLDDPDRAEPHFNEFLQLSSDQVPNYDIILYWTKYFSNYKIHNPNNEEYRRARLRFRQVLKRPMLCYDRFPKCLITNDRAYAQRAQAMIFHWGNFDPYDLPDVIDEARERQLWTLYNLEPPPMTDRMDESAIVKEYYFDLMANYRQDADVYLPYARVVKRDLPLPNDNNATRLRLPDWSAKKKTAAWAVSNCRTQSRREEYVTSLQEFIDVDIYGHCGSFSCSKQKMGQCYLDMARDYYFYLSFENSFCVDYATEKVFNILEYGMVPVVYGGAIYEKILPPGSFVDARNLKPSQLATMLQDIMADRVRYEAHFAWRRYYTLQFTDYNELLYCQLCERLAAGNVTSTHRTPKKTNEYYFENGSCWETANLEVED